jgi:hypothetical protein
MKLDIGPPRREDRILTAPPRLRALDKESIMIHHFTRTEIDAPVDPEGETSECVETLTLVRAEDDGTLYVQITQGVPEQSGILSGDCVGLYTLDGDQVTRTVKSFECVEGDRLTGDDASKVVAVLVEEANSHGARVTPADYLAEDGSLPFAAIFEDWASGGRVVEAWKPT